MLGYRSRYNMGLGLAWLEFSIGIHILSYSILSILPDEGRPCKYSYLKNYITWKQRPYKLGRVYFLSIKKQILFLLLQMQHIFQQPRQLGERVPVWFWMQLSWVSKSLLHTGKHTCCFLSFDKEPLLPWQSAQKRAVSLLQGVQCKAKDQTHSKHVQATEGVLHANKVITFPTLQRSHDVCCLHTRALLEQEPRSEKISATFFIPRLPRS